MKQPPPESEPVVYDNGVCFVCCRDESEPFIEMRGYCRLCGHFYDVHGMRILDVTARCKVHSQVQGAQPDYFELSA